ncbi:MAG: ATP-binding cassette domain-containing protein [Candidatus Gracilibacteria bacterium]|nr:ATP-binding cassette domain-containing protein [Candidatus Gracilibacteria bacterium]
MNKTIILKINNLSLEIGGKILLKNLSLEVKKGEIISVIGANGSGKTSFLKTILGLNKSFEGSLEKNYKNIGYMPQNINLDKTIPLKVSEFFKIYNKVNDTKIKEFLDKFGASNLNEKNINSLSGGELQKVLIINSILEEPELLLLDEPTNNIDIEAEELFYKLVDDIKTIFPGISIIMVSHNMKLVYHHSSTIIALHGKFHCHGTIKDLKKDENFSRYFGNYTAYFEHYHKTSIETEKLKDLKKMFI